MSGYRASKEEEEVNTSGIYIWNASGSDCQKIHLSRALPQNVLYNALIQPSEDTLGRESSQKIFDEL